MIIPITTAISKILTMKYYDTSIYPHFSKCPKMNLKEELTFLKSSSSMLCMPALSMARSMATISVEWVESRFLREELAAKNTHWEWSLHRYFWKAIQNENVWQVKRQTFNFAFNYFNWYRQGFFITCHSRWGPRLQIFGKAERIVH